MKKLISILVSAWVLVSCESTSQSPVQKIICVGTSITQGYGLSADQSYPSQLQLLEGPPDEVVNFGLSGTTILKKGAYPYYQQSTYTASLSSNPTVVILEFGTNDTKPQNWAFKDDFKQDYTELINAYKNLPTKPRIYLCIPPPAFKEYAGINPQLVNDQLPGLITAIARETNAQIINLHDLLLQQNSLFMEDGIHPTQEGDQLIAKEVYRVIH